MSIKEKDDSDRKVAWVVSITVHVLLLLAFIFMVAWREPNPPYPEYGIEVNFGTTTVGSGEEQPTTPVNTTENEEEALPEETTTEEVVEDIVEQIVEAAEETPTEPVSTTESEVITQPTESPDVIEEKTEEEVSKPVEEKPKEEITEKPVEEAPQEVKSPVVFKKKEGADGETGESTTPKNANHGDDANTVGDKGSEEGTLNATTLYGKKGGGGGAPALNISGWYWDNAPNKKDASDENGRIEFSFEVDDEGYVEKIKVIRSTVSPSVANFYKEQLRTVTFSQTNPNATPLPRTKGTVTFIIKSR